MLMPSDRIKQLVDKSPALTVDPNKQVIMYYRSGPQMVNRADMYLQDGNLEGAYSLYYKFIVLFVEQIHKHPNFNEVPSKMRVENKATLKDVMLKAEVLKEKLRMKYTKEYDEYVKEQERLQEFNRITKEQEERLKQELSQQKNQHRIPLDNLLESPLEPDTNSQPSLSGLNFPKLDVLSLKPQVTLNVDLRQAELLDSKDRTPAVDRSTKPVGLLNSNQSSQRLKTVVVPSQLFGKFQNLALKATVNNIETCGILAGRSVGRDLVITHLLVPKQKGTSNSCAAENEEEVFDYQDQNHLMTLGWIHTHPSQTAFLSSVDLHTHCPYQLMMPEAIAIVCAPKYKEDGIFSLTPDYGLDFIAKCRQTGFHPHPADPPLFMKADHVSLDIGRDVEVVDLRR